MDRGRFLFADCFRDVIFLFLTAVFLFLTVFSDSCVYLATHNILITG